MHGPMNRNRLERILEAYGGDARRWPEEERESALGLLASLPGAARLRAEARSLDLLLDAVPAQEPSPALRAAVLAAGAAARERGRLSWSERLTGFLVELGMSLTARRMAATVLAASLFCGVALGIFGAGTAASGSGVAGEYWPGAYVTSIYQAY